MRRVASLFLPMLPIERLRRRERPRAPPEGRVSTMMPVDDDPGACSVPRGGPWRPGARWARQERGREAVAAEIATLPTHQQPPIRELGRRSEAAPHPFRRELPAPRNRDAPSAPGLGWRHAPLVLSARTGQKQIVAAACAQALALRIRRGMAVTHARALVADLDVRPAEPEADRALLDRFALHAVRHWTPTVAVAAPDGLALDLTGATHLFGGERCFCAFVTGFFGRLGLTARVAIAGTHGAAHALARFGEDAITIIPAGGEADAVARLPVAALRLDPDALTTAMRFGLDHVGDLFGLPRGPLARRLGLAAVTRLDQALGYVAEPIVPVMPFDAPRAQRQLLEPIGTAEAIEQVIADLIGDLVRVLAERGLGARALDLALERVDNVEQHVLIGTARANRDGRHLLRLFRLKLDRIEPGMGIEAMRLTATRVEPLDAVTLAPVLGGKRPAPNLAPLIDLLAGRVGGSAVFRVAPVESDVPERAVVKVPPLASPAGWPAWRRPARLLARPEPLTGVVALLPDHPPRRFVWRGTPHAVVAGDGPERIFGEWWVRDGERSAVRDYYCVEDAAGGRYWIFRRGDGEDDRTGDLSWHIHGVFG